MRVDCKDFEADARQLWGRLMFDLLINDAGTDLRKIGFLYAGQGRWCLAPAHGLRPGISSSASQADGRGARFDRSADLETLVEASKAFTIKRPDALACLRRQVEVIKGWENLASRFLVNMSAADIEMLRPANTQPAS